MANSSSTSSDSPNQSKLVPNLLKGCGCLAFGAVLLAIPAVIFLPGLMSSADAARESEGKWNMVALSRAQQAYFFENEAFSSSPEELDFGMPLETENYRYSIAVQPTQPASVLMTAEPLREELSSYTGALFAVPSAQARGQTSTILCKAESAAEPVAMPAVPQSLGDRLACPANSEQVEL